MRTSIALALAGLLLIASGAEAKVKRHKGRGPAILVWGLTVAQLATAKAFAAANGIKYRVIGAR